LVEKSDGTLFGSSEEEEYIEEDEDDADLPVEQRLMNKLLRNYERSVRPVKNGNDVVLIRMGLTMTQIFDMVSTHFSLYSMTEEGEDSEKMKRIAYSLYINSIQQLVYTVCI